MTLQEAAQRKFKGKYKGPDRFKGDKRAIAAWKLEGKPKATHSATVGAAFNAKPTSPDHTGAVGSAFNSPATPIPTPNNDAVKPGSTDAPANEFNPGTATAVGARLVDKYPLATKTYKGKYAGNDKYKGIAQKGKHKGKYIGLESRKGMAKPNLPTDKPEDAVVKRLLDAQNAS